MAGAAAVVVVVQLKTSDGHALWNVVNINNIKSSSHADHHQDDQSLSTLYNFNLLSHFLCFCEKSKWKCVHAFATSSPANMIIASYHHPPKAQSHSWAIKGQKEWRIERERETLRISPLFAYCTRSGSLVAPSLWRVNKVKRELDTCIKGVMMTV